jgi:hypothetical protein
MNAETSKTSTRTSNQSLFLLPAGLATVLVIAGAITIAPPQPADATPAYAGQTGFPCGQCHINPTGGKLSKFGRNWAKHRK